MNIRAERLPLSASIWEDVLISNNVSFEIPLQPEEESMGHYIFRLDAPVLNAAKDKLIVGTWMGKTDPATGERDANPFERLGSKSVVVRLSIFRKSNDYHFGRRLR